MPVHVAITEEELRLEDYVALVRSSAAGAISTFSGTTRDTFAGRAVTRLEYEAYKSMAEKKMVQICQYMMEHWNIVSIAMVHRTGVVPVEETSVIVAVSAPHRMDAIEAMHYGIDAVKAEVPIWKKEWYLDPEDPPEWKGNCESCTAKIGSQ